VRARERERERERVYVSVYVCACVRARVSVHAFDSVVIVSGWREGQRALPTVSTANVRGIGVLHINGALSKFLIGFFVNAERRWPRCSDSSNSVWSVPSAPRNTVRVRCTVVAHQEKHGVGARVLQRDSSRGGRWAARGWRNVSVTD
jgi:hypothetical protein